MNTKEELKALLEKLEELKRSIKDDWNESFDAFIENPGQDILQKLERRIIAAFNKAEEKLQQEIAKNKTPTAKEFGMLPGKNDKLRSKAAENLLEHGKKKK